ncbi:MAG TPA: hypothetical protein PLU30_24865 [Verrucomicrobiae bacterium]|nr:hypothetical protein [Verrucomicrobiae bacterium]
MRRGGVSSNRVFGGAFSLTEVVLALAVFSLAIVSLLGLMSVALSTQRDSVMETAAANVAAAIINQRRAAPEATSENIVLPRLSDMVGVDANSAASGSEVVDMSGRKVPSADQQAQFLCQYRSWGWDDPITPHLARVHLRVLWPVELARRSPERAESYEVFTMMAGER